MNRKIKVHIPNTKRKDFGFIFLETQQLDPRISVSQFNLKNHKRKQHEIFILMNECHLMYNFFFFSSILCFFVPPSLILNFFLLSSYISCSSRTIRYPYKLISAFKKHEVIENQKKDRNSVCLLFALF